MHEILLYDQIGEWRDRDGSTGGITDKWFVEQLNSFGGEDVQLRINSPGGDAYQGMAMYSAVARYPGKVWTTVDGIAASAASYLPLSGHEVSMSEMATFMVHRASVVSYERGSEHRKTADLLDKLDSQIAGVYSAKSGRSSAFWLAEMDRESWYSSDEAKSLGLVDRIIPNKSAKAVAKYAPSAFQKISKRPDKVAAYLGIGLKLGSVERQRIEDRRIHRMVLQTRLSRAATQWERDRLQNELHVLNKHDEYDLRLAEMKS